MNEAEARSATLVRAIEMNDTAHALWSREDRQRASDAALRDASADEKASHDAGAAAFIARRAGIARERLELAHPEVAAAARAVQWPRWTAWALLLAAFAIGLASNELGADRRINIISFPLLGLLAWNAAVYVAIVAGAAAGLARRGAAHSPGVLTRLLIPHTKLRQARAGPLASALGQFVPDWLRASAPLNSARAHATLHSSAALLAAGAIAGMYIRGIGFEYLAGWESTFLTENAVYGLLAVVLGPASALSGIAVPGPEHLATLRWSTGRVGEGAAPWIHLYALTAMLFVVLPRLALALWSALAALRLRHAFALPLESDAYFRRLLALRHGKPAFVRVMPYSHTPGARAEKGLRALCAELYAGAVRIEFDEPIAYGGEDDYMVGAAGDAPDCLVVLFNIAATPEAENHGVFVERVRHALREQGRLLVVLNESPYRERLAGQAGADARLAERRRAWETVLGTRGVQPVALDLAAGDPANAAARAEVAMSEHALQAGVS